MKKNSGMLAMIFFVLVLLTATSSYGQRGSGGWGMGTAYGRMYNPKTVETIIGDVISVDKINPTKGMFICSHGLG